jgi:YggT family protein
MSTVASILDLLLFLFWLLLILRLIMEYVFMFARSFRPTGAVAALLELVYSVTDPPLRFLQRLIPPLRIGGVALDLGFLVLIILIVVVRSQVLAPLK